MPNHIQNKLTITFDPSFDFDQYYPKGFGGKYTPEEKDEVIKNLIKHLCGDGEKPHFDFDKIIPIPLDLSFNCGRNGIPFQSTHPYYHQMKLQYSAECGSSIDFARAKWGTKWGAYDCSVSDNSIKFQTAWSTPRVVIEKLSQFVPYLILKCEFADEDKGNNVGEYTFKSGKPINYIDLSGTDEGLKKAFDMFYGDKAKDQVTDYISEYAEDDPESEYVAKLNRVLLMY